MKERRKYKAWTDEQMIQAVKDSKSIAEVLRRLGLVDRAGGSYNTVWDKIAKYNLDITHFNGSSWNKGVHKPLGKLKRNPAIRKLLLKERGHKCEQCQLSEWQNHPITIELHHINGIRNDNRSENLQLLCPNCHSLTDTFKNRKRV